MPTKTVSLQRIREILRGPATALAADQPFHSSRSHPASLLHELAREHHRCSIGRTSSPFLHLVPGLERELGHHA
jgi:hypothetical protein